MHLSQPLALYILLASCANAATFSSPIQDNGKALAHLLDHRSLGVFRSSDEVSQDHRLRRRSQFPLGRPGSGLAAASDSHRVEIWDGFWFGPYIVPAALGNPPQPFRLLIDLAWDTLFVPAADCTGDCDEAGPDFKLRFYSNESSSYSSLEPYIAVAYGTDRFSGELGSDTFRIAGLEVPNQQFINAHSIEPLGFISFYYAYDGALGLAPRWNNTPFPGYPALAPSPWSSIVNQSLLDANLFALELPSGTMDFQDPVGRTGQISFGGISDKYTGSHFSHLPLTNYSDRVWAVEAQSLTWENETHPLHEDFSNLTLAGFDTTSWFLALPGNWSAQIYASVPHDCSMIDCFVDCAARKTMPNITFGLGGHRFTLTPFDYVIEVLAPGGGQKVCLFDMPSSDDWYPVDAIVLGKPFMESFYSVFDRDEKEVRLTRRID